MAKLMLELEITKDWLESVVCSALEGGSNYWLVEEFNYKIITNKSLEAKMPLSQKVALGLAKIKLKDVEGVIEKGQVWEITQQTFITGYCNYCNWCMSKGRTIETDPCNIDAEISDIILQFGLFGEIIFG